jgi:branched-chain amino acid transport system permease protein
MSGRRWLVAALAAGVAALPLVSTPFVAALALTCLMYVGLAVSWSIFSGPTRTLSLATSAFFGLGAYCTAFGLNVLPWPVLILAGGLTAALFAFLVGLVVLHLRGAYFAVLTFGLAEIAKHSVTVLEKSHFGTVGRVISDTFQSPIVYWTVALIAAGAMVAFRLVERSDLGVALRAIGSDEERAATLGVDPRRVKMVTFCLSAWFAGALGAAMAVRWTYIDPQSVFSPFLLFQTVLIAMVGGPARLRGPTIAAIGFSLLAELFRLSFPYIYMIVLGVLLISFVLFLPEGLAGVRWLGRAFEPDPRRPASGP